MSDKIQSLPSSSSSCPPFFLSPSSSPSNRDTAEVQSQVQFQECSDQQQVNDSKTVACQVGHEISWSTPAGKLKQSIASASTSEKPVQVQVHTPVNETAQDGITQVKEQGADIRREVSANSTNTPRDAEVNGDSANKSATELPEFSRVAAPNFKRGALTGEEICHAICSAYFEAVHWRRYVFMVPSGKILFVS